MITTTIHIERPAGTVIASGLPAQIELDHPLPQRDEDGARAYWPVTIYLLTIPALGLRPRDVAQDERNLDPLTGQPARYRVAGVEQFEQDYLVAACQQLIGT